eukprot:763646-Hanusia_phi.AAC.2
MRARGLGEIAGRGLGGGESPAMEEREVRRRGRRVSWGEKQGYDGVTQRWEERRARQKEKEGEHTGGLRRAGAGE